MRLTIIISLLAALGLAAVLVFQLAGDDAPLTSKAPQNSQKPSSATEVKDSPVEQPEPAPIVQVKKNPAVAETKPTPLEAPKDIPKLVAPSFDVVRVNPAGDAVIAGRAAPGATVSVLAGSEVVGTVEADDRGEWVLVPERPLESGSRELSLESKLPGAEAVKSENVVVVAVPDRPESGKSLAVLTPRKGGGPSKVLQSASSGTSRSDTTNSASASSGTSVSAQTEPVVASKSAVKEKVAAAVNQVTVASVKPNPAKKVAEKITRPAVSLDSVDYDEKGDLILSGKADVGATVNVYVDNKSVGQAVGSSEGTWQQRPESVVEAGDHKLRIDQIGTDGKVAHRVELPFTRAEPELTKLAEGQVIVQPGNSLWRIARRNYGQGVLFTVIYEANREQIRNPDLIYPGQIFALPKTDGSDG